MMSLSNTIQLYAPIAGADREEVFSADRERARMAVLAEYRTAIGNRLGRIRNEPGTEAQPITSNAE